MDEVRWLDEEEMSVWRRWLILGERVRAAIGRDLARDHGLSDAEYAVLVNLSEAADRRVRMSDLALSLTWSKSRLSHLVARMEARGLLTRQDCPSDLRGSFAALTEAGLAEITRAAPAHVASVRKHFLAHISRDQLDQLDSILGTLLTGMQTSGATTACPTSACSEPSAACADPPPDHCEEPSSDGS